MKGKRVFAPAAALVGVALFAGLYAKGLAGQPAGAKGVAIDRDDIGGVVTGAKGPEAGVWVIAETRDLPTRFARMVVTDDEGRYVLPDLPQATYDVWVRGYGLVDSPRVKARPGRILNLKAVAAPNEAAAAQYYPAIYWYSMLKIPDKNEFGGKGKIPAKVTQEEWLTHLKNRSCVGCHQMGQLSTRTFPKNVPYPLGKFASSEEAWFRRVQSGQSGDRMFSTLVKDLGGAPFKYFADWTDRIAKGELPHAKPPRPQGVERNIVVTTWDWLDEKHYLHDLIASDRRHPTVNAYGPLYGSAEYSTDIIPVLDPVRHTVKNMVAPVRDANVSEALGPGHAASDRLMQPSPYWGSEKIWSNKTNNHNAMFDRKGRVWFAARFRNADNPAFCKKGSDHPSAKLFPLERNNRQLTIFDPRTGEYTFVDTCFGTHHLQFGYDANDTLWTSGGGPVVGWVNTRLLDETGDIARAQGWTALVLDTNGNGRRDAYVEPNQPVDPTKDKRIVASFYAVMPSPVDGSVWGSQFGYPGSIVRLVPGPNPPETALAEIYKVPLPGFGVRGADIDRNGVVWVSLASGHLGSFDRRKCKGPLNGPKATGDHCPEGWSFYRYPGPGFQGLGDNSAESSYYTWVDHHNTFGLGENVPMSTGNLNDGLIAFKDGKMIVLRVPYPLGFYAKGFDGRIDDPKAGWKGRGLWTTSGDRAPWLKEGGRGAKAVAVHFQLRPHPLAK
ncbi:MAG TPA: carboxypeptidase-like regulatory domain-containing protein [candidate division Zixibacteria bacterium]|nr:carboxypeptidase-like regulatory domain-containing protein [candidate division Zixibacteria bacterium]